MTAYPDCVMPDRCPCAARGYPKPHRIGCLVPCLNKLAEELGWERPYRPEERTERITVRSGDTLWRLAQRHMGDPYRWTDLYSMNFEVIDAEINRRGLSSWAVASGDLIFPGTVLTIPVGPREPTA